MKAIIWIFLAVALTGCSTSTAILTGNARAPQEPSQVRLIFNKPSDGNYTEIARITAKSAVGWTEQGKLESALEELKVKAASLGANAVIVEQVNTYRGSDTIISGGGVGTTYLMGRREQIVNGIAIYE